MYDPSESIPVLRRTPYVLRELLRDIPNAWSTAREREDSWSPFDVVGHLIHGERTDWVQRARMILDGREEAFPPFDRFAQFEASRGRRLDDLLDEFSGLRERNLELLESWTLTPEDLQRTGQHPAFGPVTLDQLLCTWVVHDLGHIAQISRAMSARYREAVGPWREYLPVLG